MYKIPLLTNRYEVSKKIDSMRDSHGYFSSYNLKYIIMELIGYQVKENKIKDAVANSDYILDEQERIVKFSELIDIN